MILNPRRKIVTANPVQTTGLHGVKKGFPWIDTNPPAPLPAVGQTPVRDSDKQRLAFRTEADTEGWRAELLWQVSARDDIRHWGGDARSLVPRCRGPHEKGEGLCH